MNSRATLKPFVLQELLGQGGMARVFRARHGEDGAEVAVKVLMAADARKMRFRSAFADEVRAVASLNHPGIVEVYDYGELREDDIPAEFSNLQAGSPFLVMELIDGGSLHERNRAYSWSSLRSILLQILDALAHAHARGVIHRDVKPANILQTSPAPTGERRIRLADFGISDAMSRHADPSESSNSSGTPLYMAPEQFTGDPYLSGPWTDLYSLGCVAYELATGNPAFGATEPLRLWSAHIMNPRPELELPESSVPRGFEDWIHRLMAREPEDRFRHAADAAWALLQLAPPKDPSAPLGEVEATGEVSEAPTWVLGNLDTMATPTSAINPVSDVDFRDINASRSTGSHNIRPPFAQNWRAESTESTSEQLQGAGAGLYGLRTVPFVGRDDERDKLWAQLADVIERRRPGAVMLRGAAGTGKSRLASWVCYRAAELGAANYGVAYHGELPTALGAVAIMVRSLLRFHRLPSEKWDEELNNRFPEWSSEDRVALRQILAGADVTAQIDASRRRRLLRRVVADYAAHRPLILWFDNIHWSRESLEVVREWLSVTGPFPVFFVLTVQEEALAGRVDEQTTVNELASRADVSTLELTPLDDSQHRRLVSELLGFDRDLTRRIARRTGGNPLFAIELVGDWISSGLLRATDTGFELVTDTIPPLPADLFDLWDERIERLVAHGKPAVWNLALEVAAILGDTIHLDEWEAACAQAGLVVDDELRQIQTRLLDQSFATRRVDGYCFAHGMFRETLEGRAKTAGRWLDLQSACAAALQQLYPDGGPGLAERLSRHFREARRFEESFKYTIMASEERILRSNYGRATDLLDDAGRCLRELETDSLSPRWDRIQLLRLEISSERMKPSPTRDLAGELLARGIELDRPLMQAHAQKALAACASSDEQFDEAAAGFSSALEIFEEHGEDLQTARCLEGLGWVRLRAGQIDEAGDCFEQIIDLLDDSQGLEDKIVGDGLVGLATVARNRGDNDEAMRWLQRAYETARSSGNTRLLLDVVNSQGELQHTAGELDAAEASYRQCMELIEELGSGGITYVRINLALVNLGRREFDAIRELLEEPIRLLRASTRTSIQAIVELTMAAALGADGLWPEAQAYLKKGQHCMEASKAHRREALYACEVLADAARRDEKLEIASRSLHWIISIAEQLDDPDRLKQARRELSELPRQAD